MQIKALLVSCLAAAAVPLSMAAYYDNYEGGLMARDADAYAEAYYDPGSALYARDFDQDLYARGFEDGVVHARGLVENVRRASHATPAHCNTPMTFTGKHGGKKEYKCNICGVKKSF